MIQRLCHRFISFYSCFVLCAFQLVTDLKETVILYLWPGAVLGWGLVFPSLNYLEMSFVGDGT